jgi:hypothetical protein
MKTKKNKTTRKERLLPDGKEKERTSKRETLPSYVGIPHF